MPKLNANLVSVGTFNKAGLTTTFGNGKGIVQKADGTIILAGDRINWMYLLETLDDVPRTPLAMTSLSQPTSLEQWHHCLARCSLLTIQDMANGNLVDGMKISEMTINGKCEDCIVGCQTRCPFDGVTEKDMAPLELIAFDLWGPSRVQSAGGKIYLMMIVDAGSSFKYGAYLSDKSDATTVSTFEIFCAKAETATGKKIRRIRTD